MHSRAGGPASYGVFEKKYGRKQDSQEDLFSLRSFDFNNYITRAVHIGTLNSSANIFVTCNNKTGIIFVSDIEKTTKLLGKKRLVNMSYLY